MPTHKLFKVLSRRRATASFPNLEHLPQAAPIHREGRSPTVLCLHGFTGVPADVALACEVASELGLATHAPLLAGHGTTPHDLAPLRFSHWVEGVRTHFLEARKEGPVILVGLSLGSLIAAELTLEMPFDVAGLVLMANAFWLHRPHPELTLQIAERLHIPDRFVSKSGPDLADQSARRRHVGYLAQPLHSAISLRNAGERLRKQLHRIDRPTLLLHGAHDHVSPVSNAWRAASRLGTRDAKIIVYPRSRHILPLDLDHALVKEDLRCFFARLSGKTGS